MIQKVVGVAFIENGKLLIVQSHRSSKTNSWTFVGGGVEEGETLVEAAIREVSEEILHYHWYSPGEDYNISSSIKDHFLPFAQKNNLIY